LAVKIPLHQENWTRIRAGDQSALVVLYKTMYQVLLNAGTRYTNDQELLKDHIQQLFLHLWEQREKLPAVQFVRTYVINAYRNRLVNSLKKIPRFVPVTEEEGNDLFIERSYLEKLLDYQDNESKRARLERALTCLTERQLELLEMRFFLQMSYAEMEAALGISRKTIYNIIFNSLESLRGNMR
jgi:RNA polymerase sigma factor (sigma-70 family)